MIAKNPQYAPNFKVEIQGVEIPWALRASIMSVRLTAGMEGADRVDLSIFNEHLKWLDDLRFAINTPIRLWLGYAPDPLALMFAGEIKAVQATFPAGNTPTLEVSAQDKITDMQKGTNSRWFAADSPQTTNLPIPRQTMASQVALHYHMTTQFDSTGADLERLVGSVTSILTEAVGAGDPGVPQKGVDRQINTQDYNLLRRLAQESGYDLMIDHTSANAGKVLLFVAPWQHLAPNVRLAYGESLIEFTPRLTDVGQIRSVTANVWQPERTQIVAVTLGWNWKRMGLTVQIQPGQAKSVAGSADLVIDEPLTVGTAPRRLIAELFPKLNSRITGTASAVGDPVIRPGAVVRIEGVGAQFGGYYRVTSSTHTIDASGYRTQFDVRKEIWFTLSATAQGAVRVFLPSPEGTADDSTNA
jgi:hypothetical protein